MFRNNRGFTLIELMIVIVILAILAAIAFPSYQRYVTKSWVEKAKSALQENALFMERMNMRFLGYTTARGGSVIATANLPIRNLCTGNCGRNYTFQVGVSNDSSSYILVATPTGAQQKEADCGAMIMDSSGGNYAIYNSGGTYEVNFPGNAKDYRDPEKVRATLQGKEVSDKCFR